MKKILHLIAALFAITFSAQAQSQNAPSLGVAQDYAVLGSSSVNNVGATLVYADLGTSPGTVITGNPVVLGQINPGTPEAAAAKTDAMAAYNFLGNLQPTQNLTGQRLGKGFSQTAEAVNGTKLGPGVYRFDGDARHFGQLRLDGGGDPNAVFVFQVNGNLMIDQGSVTLVQNGAQPRNIFFRVTGNVITGTGGVTSTSSGTKGNVLVQNNITLNNGSTHEGRLLSLNGNVFLDNNTIFLPSLVEADLAITKKADGEVFTIGDTVTYTITVRNQGPDDATGVRVVEVFPSQLEFIDASPTSIPFKVLTPSSIQFTVGTVAFGETVVITVRARVIASGTNILNRVNIVGDNVDPDDEDDKDEEPIDVPSVVTDLSVLKTVDKTRASVGDQINYTVTIRNNGPAAATGVVVKDVLPASQVDFSGQATVSTGSYNMSTGIWSVGNLAIGATATLTVSGTITGTGTIVNTATIKGNESDQQPGNNTSTVVTVVGPGTGTDNLADLQVSKSVDKSRAATGETITYTITARNNGPAAATGVTVTDLLPAGVNFTLPPTLSSGTYNATTGVWTIGNLGVGTTATFTVTGTITATSGNIVNTAVIKGDQVDERPENNTSTVVTIITDGGIPDPDKVTDLQVVKSVDKTRATVGQTLSYSITVRNNGPNAATNVFVVDVLPAGQVTFGTPSLSAGTYTAATGIWTIGNLAKGATATFNVTGTITKTGTIVNTAVVRGNEADPQPQNNTSTVITVVTDQTGGPITDLQIVKTVDKARANVGDEITYVLTARNIGPAAATGVVVEDRLPSSQINFAGQPVVSSGSYNMSTGIWTIGNLTVGQTATLTVMGVITATGTIVNTAKIGGNESDQNPEDNTSTVITVVDTGTGTDNSADLQVVKRVDKTRAAKGQTITYTITARNAGPADATGVTVVDMLPSNQATFGTATVSNGTYIASTGIWTIGNLAVGSTATLTVTGTITANDGNIFNTAVIDGDQDDSRPENNTSTVVTVITTVTDPNPDEVTDLEIVKTVNRTRAQVGDGLTYTVTARNNGPNNATGVLVSDVLPSQQVNFAGQPTVSQGSYNAATGFWTVGNLAAGEVATLTISGTISATGTIVNTAIVRGNEADPQPQNNTSTVVTIVDGDNGPGGLADLQVTKTVDKTRATVGQGLFYVVTARNNGPNNATGVVVRDLLPTGQLTLNGQPNVSVGSYNTATGIWNIGNLANGQVAILTVSGTITTTGTIVNTAIIGGNEADQNPDNNSATVITVVGVGPGTGDLADLQVVKSVNKTRAKAGETITYNIAARNAGPNAATGVMVKDVLPAGATFGAVTVSKGSYSATTGIWTIGNLGVGQSATLSVAGTVTATSGTIVNTAVISGDQTDERPENNTSTVITIIDAKGDPDPALATDLQVVKRVDKTVASVGNSLQYIITARNNGPGNATGVFVLDVLPTTQLTLVGAPILTRGTYNAATGIWTIGNLAKGQSVTMTVNATINTTGTIVNTAVIRGNEADTQPQNNTSTVITVVELAGQPANVSIAKSTVGNVTEVTIGENIMYQLEARNAGPGTATGVTVTDVLPEGLVFVSADPADQYNPTTGVWTIGNITAGAAPRILTITATTTKAGKVANTAVIKGNETDPDDEDNTDTEETCVKPSAPIVGNASVCVGSNATFAINAIAGVTTFEVTGLPAGVTRVAGGGNTVTLQVGPTAAAGTYNLSFIAINSNTNCSNSVPSTATLKISAVPGTPGPITISSGVVCTGVPVTFSIAPVTGATSYVWTLPADWTFQGAKNGPSITVIPGVVSGTVSVKTEITGNACGLSAASTSANFTPGNTPGTPTIVNNTSICSGLQYAIQTPESGVTYTWTAPMGFVFANNQNTTTGTSVTLSSAVPTASGTLSVTATSGGCGSTSATIEVRAADADTGISIPTVFSPNGDGINDKWVIRNLLKYPDNELNIYNRWGNEVFKTNNYQNDWTASGLEQATYFYVLRVKGCDGQDQTYRGPVQVVR